MSSLPDIAALLEAKSNQSNAADLISRPVVGTIMHKTVNLTAQQQPVSIWLDCLPRDKPWKPCKTALRLMAGAWGTTDPNVWIGRRVRLYHEEDVHFEKNRTGGIRVSHVSHITSPYRKALQEKRGKFRMWEVHPLSADAPRVDASPPDLDATMADLELTRDEVDAYLVSQSKPPIGDLDDAQRVALAGALPKLADKIRAKRGAP